MKRPNYIKVFIEIAILPLYLFFVSPATGAEKAYCNSIENQCTFVLYSESSNRQLVVNETRADQPMSPFSTFKIPNTLMALEKGIVTDVEQLLSFDKTRYPVQEWWPNIWYNEPLKIRDAFQHSAVPIYQELAKKLGDTSIKKFLKSFNYGNRDISSGVDTFWLNGSLTISANQQVDFIRALYNNRFSLREKSLLLFKKIMLVESTDDYKLYAKTGAGPVGENTYIGWYVGFVENKSGVHYFAFNMDAKTLADIKEKRIDIAKNHLVREGVL